MKKISLNADWTVRPLSRPGEPRRVNLPHDAMLDEPRGTSSTGADIGGYPGGDYEYTKVLPVPEEWAGKKAVLEFEGVYRNAEVFLNGEPAAFYPYGYTDFRVEAGELLRPGEDNELRVIAHNADQPNSRWYTGTGIYRPAWLWLGGEEHILMNGVRVRTLDARRGEIEVHVRTSRPGALCLEILDGDAVLLRQRHTSRRRGVRFRVTLAAPRLWSPDHPHLYTARVTFGEDVAEAAFGIRALAWSAREGLTLNGERVILRGACVHHDNGPLGACAFPEAEERKVRLLKECGYNALRSAHNPCSRALLEACDRLGMLVLDEYTDVWTEHKTPHDYASWMRDWWRQDLEDMVDKDYNHPSVVLYSIGNEVAETAGPEGVRLAEEMTGFLHGLDDSRPVTCGINVFYNLLSAVGLGTNREGGGENRAVGSAFYNKLAWRLGDRVMKWGSALPGSDARARDAFACLDVAGYNYGIQRYEADLKKYPERLILGTESLCGDAWRFWDMAREHPAILGDFAWTGMDYMGETALGAPEYGDYRMAGGATRMTGGFGRLDITGRPRAEAAYTRVALGQQAGPSMAVWPVYRDDAPALTGWQLTRAVESWAWTGCAGRPATVEVYARAAEVELRLNGRSLGRKRASRTCRTLFRVPWEAGRLEAISYDAAGQTTGTCALRSAGPETELRLLPEAASVRPGGLCFARLRFTDARGVWKPMERRRLTAAVENGELAGLCCGNAYVAGNYGGPSTDTYYGEALAVLRAGTEGFVTLTVTAEGMAPVDLAVPVRDEEPVLLSHPTEPPEAGEPDPRPIPPEPTPGEPAPPTNAGFAVDMPSASPADSDVSPRHTPVAGPEDETPPQGPGPAITEDGPRHAPTADPAEEIPPRIAEADEAKEKAPNGPKADEAKNAAPLFSESGKAEAAPRMAEADGAEAPTMASSIGRQPAPPAEPPRGIHAPAIAALLSDDDPESPSAVIGEED